MANKEELIVTKTWGDLQRLIEHILKDVKSNGAAAVQSGNQPEELLTRAQTKDFLQISLVTLDKWTREGIIPGYRIGGRKYYKKSEILENLESIMSHKFAR